jgi:hypothetical protein
MLKSSKFNNQKNNTSSSPKNRKVKKLEVNMMKIVYDIEEALQKEMAKGQTTTPTIPEVAILGGRVKTNLSSKN